MPRQSFRLALVCLTLAACVQGPNHVRPAAPVPDHWSRTWPGTQQLVGTQAWWEDFADPVLTGLIQRARQSNPDLRVATARIAESRASLVLAGVALQPSMGASASYNRERPSGNGIFSLAGSSPAQAPKGTSGASVGVAHPAARDFNLFQAGFDASWEPDFWGKAARGIEAADAGLLASSAGRDIVLSTMATEIGRNYILLRSTQQDLALAERVLALHQRSSALIRSRVANGLSTSIELANSEASAASAEAVLAPLRNSEQSYRNAIGQLLGAPPGALDAELSTRRPVPELRRPIPLSMPAEMAARRPDIQQAEALLHQATANIGVARADYFPNVTLSASFALQALRLANPDGLAAWGSRQFAAGPQLTVPIFDGGRVAGNVVLAESLQVEAFENYRRIVLAALHDVENGLNTLQNDNGRADVQATQVASLEQALNLQRQLTAAGLVDELREIDAEQAWLAALQLQGDVRAQVASDQIAAFKALGLGWPAMDRE